MTLRDYLVEQTGCSVYMDDVIDPDDETISDLDQQVDETDNFRLISDKPLDMIPLMTEYFKEQGYQPSDDPILHGRFFISDESFVVVTYTAWKDVLDHRKFESLVTVDHYLLSENYRQ